MKMGEKRGVGAGIWEISSLQPAAVQANKEQTDSMIDHFGWIHCWTSVHVFIQLHSVLLHSNLVSVLQ